jgi:MarR family transcriptional regulator, lower aerobic nicotinate degradation pathway regulator
MDQNDSGIGSYDPRQHPAQLIRRVHQRAAQLFTQNVLVANLSAIQFVSLVTLLKHGPMPLGQLGRMNAMDPSTTTVMARTLQKAGLIVRSRSQTDQRARLIALTEAGRACALAHVPISQVAGEALLAPLSPGERALFLELLRKLLPVEP